MIPRTKKSRDFLADIFPPRERGLPSYNKLHALPRLVRVAFMVRLAHRARPCLDVVCPTSRRRPLMDRIVRQAEQVAAGSPPSAVPFDFRDIQNKRNRLLWRTLAAGQTFNIAFKAIRAADPRVQPKEFAHRRAWLNAGTTDLTEQSIDECLDAFENAFPRRKEIRLVVARHIIADYKTLARAQKQFGWTRRAVVSQDIFGPMWVGRSPFR